MNELEKIILNGTTLNLTDTTARTTATAAKQTADSALDRVVNITYDGTQKALVID